MPPQSAPVENRTSFGDWWTLLEELLTFNTSSSQTDSGVRSIEVLPTAFDNQTSDSFVPDFFFNYSSTAVLTTSMPPATYSNKTHDCTVLGQASDYEIPFLVASSVCVVLGAVYVIVGYRFFKGVLFLTGFLFGSLLIYLVCDKEQLLPALGNAGVGLGAGVLFGLICMLVQYVGLFMTGFLTGLCVGVVVLLGVQILYTPDTLWMTIGVLFGCGLLGSLVTLKWQRAMVILGTSLIGGAVLAASLDYFTERFYSLHGIWNVLTLAGLFRPICWHSWLLVALWPALFLCGILIQCFRPYLYRYRRQRLDSSSPKRDSPGAASNTGSRHSNRDLQQAQQHVQAVVSGSPPGGVNQPGSYATKPYRLLYQSRRANGDVICQSYLESLQRLSKLHETATISSDQTRLTMLTNGSNKSNQSSESST